MADFQEKADHETKTPKNGYVIALKWPIISKLRVPQAE
jgi:hypothetical protein